MKKIKVVQIIGYVLFIIYLGLIIGEWIWGYWKDFENIAFSILLAIVSLSLIYKGVLIKSSSTLWFAVSLIIYAITIIIFEYLKIDPQNYYYIFVLIPIIASLINLAVFQNLIYIKVIILNISIAIPVFLSRFLSLSIWWILFIRLISVFIGIIICRSINLDKERV